MGALPFPCGPPPPCPSPHPQSPTHPLSLPCRDDNLDDSTNRLDSVRASQWEQSVERGLSSSSGTASSSPSASDGEEQAAATTLRQPLPASETWVFSGANMSGTVHPPHLPKPPQPSRNGRADGRFPGRCLGKPLGGLAVRVRGEPQRERGGCCCGRPAPAPASVSGGFALLWASLQLTHKLLPSW